MGRWEDYQLRGKRRRQLLREERETRIGWRRALALWARAGSPPFFAALRDRPDR